MHIERTCLYDTRYVTEDCIELADAIQSILYDIIYGYDDAVLYIFSCKNPSYCLNRTKQAELLYTYKNTQIYLTINIIDVDIPKNTYHLFVNDTQIVHTFLIDKERNKSSDISMIINVCAYMKDGVPVYYGAGEIFDRTNLGFISKYAAKHIVSII